MFNSNGILKEILQRDIFKTKLIFYYFKHCIIRFTNWLHCYNFFMKLSLKINVPLFIMISSYSWQVQYRLSLKSNLFYNNAKVIIIISKKNLSRFQVGNWQTWILKIWKFVRQMVTFNFWNVHIGIFLFFLSVLSLQLKQA